MMPKQPSTAVPNSDHLKDVAEELKILLRELDFYNVKPVSFKARARLVGSWLKNNQKDLPSIAPLIPSSCWSCIDFDVAQEVLQAKKAVPSFSVPLRVIFNEVSLEGASPQDGLQFVQTAIPLLTGKELEVFAELLEQFLSDARTCQNSKKSPPPKDFLKNISLVLEDFRTKCVQLGEEKTFLSFVSGLSFDTLGFIRPLLSKEGLAQSFRSTEESIIALVLELKKPKVSEEALSNIMESVIEEQLKRNPPQSLLDTMHGLLLHNATTKMVPFLKACANIPASKLKFFLPNEYQWLGFLSDGQLKIKNKECYKQIISGLASLNLPKDFINNICSHAVLSCTAISSVQETTDIKKHVKMIQDFQQNNVKFAKFTIEIPPEDVCDWFETPCSIASSKKVQDVFTALASVSPPSVALLLSQLFTINGVSWSSPTPTKDVFKINSREFREAFREIKMDIENDENDQRTVQRYNKMKHFVNLCEKNTIMSHVKAPLKATTPPPKRKM